MNINWHKIPLLRLLLPLIAGICISIYANIYVPGLLYVLCFLFIASGIFVFAKKISGNYKNRIIYGTLISLLFFAAGYYLGLEKSGRYDPQHFSRHISNIKNEVVITLTEPIKETEKSVKIIGEVLQVKNKGTWEGTTGKVLVYLQKDRLSKKLRYGDCIITDVSFENISNAGNPNEFDYKQFLAHQSIYKRAYIKASEWHQLPVNKGIFIKKYACDLRDKLLKIYASHLKGNEYAVASALVLGYDDDIDNDLLQAYSNAGVLHVLSVSGLHVALVYLVLNTLLSFLDKKKIGKYFKLLLLISFLWFYALLTGFSPSVLRSVAMLSFIIIGNTFDRNSNTYNTLLASALLLLLLDPFMITQIGFQLSYLAVFGILYIHPLLHKQLETDNYWLGKIWELTSVSIAAQLITFPLSVYYFHQFPNYFIIGNLLIIPLTTAVMYACMALLVVAPFAVLGLYIAKLCYGLLFFLNGAVLFIEQLPYSFTTGISISLLQAIISYVLLILLILFLVYKHINYLRFVLVCCIAFMLVGLVRIYDLSKQKEIVVYNVSKNSAVDFIYAGNHVFLSEKEILEDRKKMQYAILNNWYSKHLSGEQVMDINARMKTSTFFKRNNYLQFYNKKLIIADNTVPCNKTSEKPLPVDYLLVRANPKIKIKDILQLYAPKQIIFDASNSVYKTTKWARECEALNVNAYNMHRQGALIMEL